MACLKKAYEGIKKLNKIKYDLYKESIRQVSVDLRLTVGLIHFFNHQPITKSLMSLEITLQAVTRVNSWTFKQFTLLRYSKTSEILKISLHLPFPN